MYYDDEDNPLPIGRLSNTFIADGEYMHRNIFINSNRQKSSQGSVFFVKLSEEIPHSIKSRDFVLKVYSGDNEKSFRKEI